MLLSVTIATFGIHGIAFYMRRQAIFVSSSFHESAKTPLAVTV
jgi:hypothetical protein